MEERVKKAERRLKTVEEAILTLSQQALIHSDWFDEMREFQANTDAKIAALVDALIKSEDEMREFRRETNEFRQETNEFRRETKKMFTHLIKLIDKMDKRIELLEKKITARTARSNYPKLKSFQNEFTKKSSSDTCTFI